MKLKNGLVITQANGSNYIVDTSNKKDSFNGMIRLNDSALFIVELLKNDISYQEIIKAMTDFYGIPEETARKGADKVIEKLRFLIND